MNQTDQLAFCDYYAGGSGSSRMERQLQREITCLERQLERLRLRRDLLESATLREYQEMIESRQLMLDDLRFKSKSCAL